MSRNTLQFTLTALGSTALQCGIVLWLAFSLPHIGAQFPDNIRPYTSPIPCLVFALIVLFAAVEAMLLVRRSEPVALGLVASIGISFLLIMVAYGLYFMPGTQPDF